VLPRVGATLRQRLVESELAAVEREVLRSFQASPVAGLIMTMAGGEVVDVNERFLSLYGFARDEVVGASAIDLGLFPRTADRAAAMMRLLESAEPSQIGAHVRTRTGELVPVRAVLDVTERAGARCARAMVVDAPAAGGGDAVDFRALCDALPTGVAVLRGARCVWANEALRSALGLDLGGDGADVNAWLPAPTDDAPATSSGPSPLGPDTRALVASDGRRVPVECSPPIPVVFAGAAAVAHTIDVRAPSRVRLGSGVAPPPPAREHVRRPR
jgi:PAS domain S-box-containing protein